MGIGQSKRGKEAVSQVEEGNRIRRGRMEMRERSHGRGRVRGEGMWCGGKRGKCIEAMEEEAESKDVGVDEGSIERGVRR